MTLSPEKEAEARFRSDAAELFGKRTSDDGMVAVVLVRQTDATEILATLSTERQAREAAEAELAQWRSDNPPDYAEVRAAKDRAIAAEKEVERLQGALHAEGHAYEDSLAREDEWAAELDKRVGSIHEAQEARIDAEAKLAALERRIRCVIVRAEDDDAHDTGAFDPGCEVCGILADLRSALSALPPPVPAEEAEMLNDANAWYSTVQLQEGAAKYFGRGDVPLQLGDRVRVHTGEEGTIRQFLAGQTKCVHVMFGPKVGGTYFPFECEKLPTQAPQDVAGLVEGDLEWLRECVEEGRITATAIERARTVEGRRAYLAQNARIDRILSALRASPISQEDRPLELAAADNNHKALVERDPAKLDAKLLTDAELIAEQTRVEKLWDSMFEPDEDGEVFEGHGGSPGEWMQERMMEIADEQQRRAAFQSRQEGKAS